MSASLGVNAVCGPGKRYKVLACQNDRGEMEAANQCSLKREYHYMDSSPVLSVHKVKVTKI